jgi:hemolysin activation/secretion protein
MTRHALLLLLLLPCLAPAALAQTVRPGQERPTLPSIEEEKPPPTLTLPDIPDFEPKPRAPGDILPPLEAPEPGDLSSLEAGGRVRIEAIETRGNTVLPPNALEAIESRYAGRELDLADLEALRDELTLAYVERGYVTSGAVIPSQSVAGGVLVVDLVEGVLQGIEIETDGRLRPGYLRARLERSAGSPVNVRELEEALQVLQQDERIRSVEAALVPGERRGESVLRVRVYEQAPWVVTLAGDNHASPVIGEWRGTAEASYANLIGIEDVLSAEYQGSSGLNDVRAAFETPFTPWGTRIALHMRRTWSEVVEDPFADLDIEADTETYGLTLTQPVWRSRHLRTDLFATGEWRRSESYLGGERFSFVPGPHDGVAKIAVVRFGTDALYRSSQQVVALRSMLSVGLDALDSTINSGEVPDSRFVSWLLQAQGARRLPWLETQIFGALSLQLADRPLLGLEQFALGGRYTVRGYRESQLVRDQGVAGTLELRFPVPLPHSERWRPSLALAPFFDAGRSWNADRGTTGDQNLASVGIGLLLGLNEQAHFEIYWGDSLENVSHFGEDSLEDEGIHLGLTVTLP